MEIAQKFILTSLLIVSLLAPNTSQACEPEEAAVVETTEYGHPKNCPCLHAYNDKSRLKKGDENLEAGNLTESTFLLPKGYELERFGISPSGRLIGATASKLSGNSKETTVMMWDTRPYSSNQWPQWTTPLNKDVLICSMCVSDANEEICLINFLIKFVTIVTKNSTKTINLQRTSLATFVTPLPGNDIPQYAIVSPPDLMLLKDDKIERETFHSDPFRYVMESTTTTPYHAIMAERGQRDLADKSILWRVKALRAYCLQSKKWLELEECEALRPPVSFEQMLKMSKRDQRYPEMPNTATGDLVSLHDRPMLKSVVYPKYNAQITYDGQHLVYAPEELPDSLIKISKDEKDYEDE